VLPHSPQGVRGFEGYRYVDFAIYHLIQQMEGSGAAPGEVQVKLFGGADVLPVGARRSWRATVGQQNCQAALEVLRRENYSILTSDIGGLSGRTIQFDTETGIVLVRRLERLGVRGTRAGWQRKALL